MYGYFSNGWILRTFFHLVSIFRGVSRDSVKFLYFSYHFSNIWSPLIQFLDSNNRKIAKNWKSQKWPQNVSKRPQSKDMDELSILGLLYDPTNIVSANSRGSICFANSACSGCLCRQVEISEFVQFWQLWNFNFWRILREFDQNLEKMSCSR